MNLQIRIQVPKPEGSASYVHDTDVEVITDPTVVRAVLAAILACEAAVAAGDAPETVTIDVFNVEGGDEALVNALTRNKDRLDKVLGGENESD